MCNSCCYVGLEGPNPAGVVGCLCVRHRRYSGLGFTLYMYCLAALEIYWRSFVCSVLLFPPVMVAVLHVEYLTLC